MPSRTYTAFLFNSESNPDTSVLERGMTYNAASNFVVSWQAIWRGQGFRTVQRSHNMLQVEHPEKGKRKVYFIEEKVEEGQ